jgi:hypothetical protein
MTNDITKSRETEGQPSFGGRDVLAGCLAFGGVTLAASVPAISWPGVQSQAKSGKCIRHFAFR